MDLKIHNRLRDTIVEPEGHDERLFAISKLVEKQYGKPVAVGIVVGLQFGDGFDFMMAGTMDPEDIGRAVGHVTFMRDYVTRQHAERTKDSIPQPTKGPLAELPADTWAGLPTKMRNLLIDAAAQGVEVFYQQDGAADPLDEVLVSGLDDED